MARGAHGWPSLHICRAAGEAISRAKYQPIFTNARWILYLCLKSAKRKLLACRRPCFASAWNCSACTVVRCGRTDLIDLFPIAFINSQMAQVESPRILERVVPVQVRSAAKSLQLHFFFLLKIEDLENSKSFRSKGWLFTPKNNCLVASYSLFSSKLFTV